MTDDSNEGRKRVMRSERQRNTWQGTTEDDGREVEGCEK